MAIGWRVGCVVLGTALVMYILLSAVRTFVLPRSANEPLTRVVFRGLRAVFLLPAAKSRSYEARDHIMALYAPISLLVLPGVWLVLVLLGYSAIYAGLGVTPWLGAFRLSGSSLFTLGYVIPEGLPQTVAAFSEATIGLGLIALLIAYLPTMYAAFSRRETAVTMLEVRAGSPPSAITLLERFHRLQRLDQLGELWRSWEVWFTEVEETHTSLTALVFFRSPQGHRSWITAAGAVLDAASLTAAIVDLPRDPSADLCIRAGYLALRHVADFFRIPYDPDPAPDGPISISRGEFDSACDTLAGAGLRLKPDRDQGWRDYRGWRVNYDTVLLALARLTMAPYAPWSSDRSLLPRSKEA